MMQFIRSKVGKVLVFLIIPAFLGWMVFEIGMDAFSGGATRPGQLGSVNGQAINFQAWSERYNSLLQQAQQQGADVTPEMERRIRDEAWEQLVGERLLEQELAERGITVTDAEVVWAAKNLPHPSLAQQEIFLTNGQFDINKYRQFLGSPQMTPDMFMELERYYREALPREKLARQLAAGRYLSDAELWRAFQDRTETATVDYVQLPLDKLVRTAPTVSNAEIRAYYNENRDEFRRPEGARVKVAYLPLTVTESDRQATLRRAQELRQEIAGGADFGEVARRESEDKQTAPLGGELGSFGRGQMVPSFDSAAFSLPVNEVSQPVVTQYGVHLIQVQERTGDQAKARHILLPFAKSPAALDSLQERMETLAANAGKQGLQRAAQAVPGVVFRDGVELTADAPYLPGVGPAMEALNWASEAQADRDAGDGTGISEPLESDQALYLVQLDEYHPAGEETLAQATAKIRERLARRKLIQAATVEAEKVAAEIRGGRTLEQVAQARGLTVQRAGPFTRVEPNPVFGQANAAVGAAFGTPVGRVGPVAETPAGVFLVRPVARTAADRAAFEAQKAAQRQQAGAALQQDLFSQWLSDARQNAQVKDNRARVLNQSS